MSPTSIKTRFLILSDTHGAELPESCFEHSVDVVIHCGDLTNSSYITEFQTTIKQLQRLKAPLKLVIAGNHDFTLDTPTLEQKIREAGLENDPSVKKVYGDYEEVRTLFKHEQGNGIIFLDEGTHSITLPNGALLNIYASPYTPSLGDWGFQYHPERGHDFQIEEDVDIVITHGPPRGIMDYTDNGRAGCPDLFMAVARARPRMHCFGHIHEGWGAMIAQWRDRTFIGNEPSHFTAIDYGRSSVVTKLSRLDPETSPAVVETSHCTDDAIPLKPGHQTLFINAAFEASNMAGDGLAMHPVWQVDLELPCAI
ncbi:metallophosphoesterase domain-containing protein [Aspergillus eucalypticola CBS 122712]|uniref:Metallophosphoesterase domain-containing protein n=1 Tax=Aspergillus eucalypticola (strain CBS 122712 / IBT 29274) TaxID=1448314 RepID=A0A317VMU0_ASPEC|nr:metallophosphoesterase domain-containing protein [Aspergillus eucalypticola CBS 122712]PWY74889.1 metallophosphoesterase domain-containing protein [Aspergillus eucalypticola CBS 122712]